MVHKCTEYTEREAFWTSSGCPAASPALVCCGLTKRPIHRSSGGSRLRTVQQEEEQQQQRQKQNAGLVGTTLLADSSVRPFLSLTLQRNPGNLAGLPLSASLDLGWGGGQEGGVVGGGASLDEPG
ncbi:hypothetical protein CPLU01_01041 [Colletotrichum plurivorum]|uniref:Uncharacterized protein n=1 Tax=Colletotrichum plurivorum TaxID=2175906 RepID=A0A8H6NQF1_9PEZI|nr:hypothetical protein CPLU01_01041 [Colletotrichum plurivorum]